LKESDIHKLSGIHIFSVIISNKTGFLFLGVILLVMWSANSPKEKI
jgi:hypothetical protein